MTENKLNILLAEDDLNLGILLVDFLESRNVKVTLFRDGESAFNGFKKGDFNFCILDVMLPKVDGFTIAKKVKTINAATPVVFLTARGMKEDKMKGYDIGADDYITKPFDEDELWCKIVAISKRTDLVCASTEKVFKIGMYEFDFENLSLNFQDSIKRLTTREAEILRMLCQSKNNLVRREQILTAIWGENDYFAGRSMDVFISKLRKYMSQDPNVQIENVIKVGYILNC
ncbi:response regulator transcription factor [Prolixibacteraceae bacterium Z1-6]|uniref:Response regulator transcription factor n=1 Tax=Draconibacterium aestuarii TaxID=2998507 RepID=A0A9X3F9Z7_9BACT|nr:response regulator transcription factor [Prolixibacteraceae bacterium Z1-6]